MHSTASGGATVHGSLVPQETIEQVHDLVGCLTRSATETSASLDHHTTRVPSLEP